MALEKQAEVLIHHGTHHTVVAVINVLGRVELLLSEGETQSIIGNVYRGRVMRVMHNLGAAFIDIGLLRHAFLPYRHLGYDAPRLIEGDEILVQVQKNPMGEKGAKVGLLQSVASRYFVWKADLNEIICSRRLVDESEYLRLVAIYKKMFAESGLSGGGIVRTQAPQVDESLLISDWKIMQEFKAQLDLQKDPKMELSSHRLLVNNQDFPVKYFRDIIQSDVEKIWIDDAELYQECLTICRKYWPDLAVKIIFYEERLPLLQRHSVDQVIISALVPRVELPSGGWLNIESTEGMWVVDVNGTDSGLVTNSEAAREIARQIRLRNMAGLIVIDFIRMPKVTEQQAVLSILQKEMLGDTEKVHCVGFTPSGLVEVTREKSHHSLQEVLTRPCIHCQGLGYQRF